MSKIYSKISQAMYKQFNHMLQAENQELVLQDKPKCVEDVIYNILDYMIPWETNHIQDTHSSFCAWQTALRQRRKKSGKPSLKVLTRQRHRAPETVLETTIAHVCIDQRICLERVKSWLQTLKTVFDHWRLPLLQHVSQAVKGAMGGSDDLGPPPPDVSNWHEIEEKIMKEILWSERRQKLKLNRQQDSRAVFDVLVDGKVHACIRQDAPEPLRLSLTDTARYIEIQDQETAIMVANCHLMDPEDLPAKGWSRSMVLPAGGQLHVTFIPEREGEALAEGMTLELNICSPQIQWISIARWKDNILVWGAETVRRMTQGVTQAWQAAFHHDQTELKTVTGQARAALRSVPWIVGIQSFAIMLLVCMLVVQHYRNQQKQAQDQLLLQVRTAIAEGYRDATRLLTLTAKTESGKVFEEAQRIRVVPAVAAGRTYPYPTLRQIMPSVAFVKGLEHSSTLQVEYEVFLRQWGEVFRVLAGTLMQTGKIPDAIRVLEYLVQSSHLDSEDASDREQLLGFLYGLGELYKANGDHTAAIAVYDKIMAYNLAPNDPRPAHYAGWSSYKLKHYETALDYYNQALHIDPQYAKVFYNKALVFHGQNQEERYQDYLETALTLTLQAYHKEGDENPRIPFTLAILHAVREEPEESLDFLERALRKQPLYVVRSEKEHAFHGFRDDIHPYHETFRTLLDRYRPPQNSFSARSEATYDPTRFYE